MKIIIIIITTMSIKYVYSIRRTNYKTNNLNSIARENMQYSLSVGNFYMKKKS